MAKLDYVEPKPRGTRFGMLTATGGFERRQNRKAKGRLFWHPFHEAICECGVTVWIRDDQWGVTRSCRACGDREAGKKNTVHGLSGVIQMHLWAAAKARAKRRGIPFSLHITDITLPQVCPVLGIALDERRGVTPDRRARANAPSLDRIDPSLGYTPDNVAVISHRANNLKKDGSADEHLAIASFMRSHGVEG
jgi:hypothetical protein